MSQPQPQPQYTPAPPTSLIGKFGSACTMLVGRFSEPAFWVDSIALAVQIRAGSAILNKVGSVGRRVLPFGNGSSPSANPAEVTKTPDVANR